MENPMRCSLSPDHQWRAQIPHACYPEWGRERTWWRTASHWCASLHWPWTLSMACHAAKWNSRPIKLKATYFDDRKVAAKLDKLWLTWNFPPYTDSPPVPSKAAKMNNLKKETGMIWWIWRTNTTSPEIWHNRAIRVAYTKPNSSPNTAYHTNRETV